MKTKNINLHSASFAVYTSKNRLLRNATIIFVKIAPWLITKNRKGVSFAESRRTEFLTWRKISLQNLNALIWKTSKCPTGKIVSQLRVSLIWYKFILELKFSLKFNSKVLMKVTMTKKMTKTFLKHLENQKWLKKKESSLKK